MKKIICIITMMMMVATMIPYTAFAAAHPNKVDDEVIEGELGTEDNIFDAICSHSWSSWSITTPPTCTEKGVQERTCTLCGDINHKEVAAKGHDYVVEGIAKASLTENGYKDITCNACGDSYDETIYMIKTVKFSTPKVIYGSATSKLGLTITDSKGKKISTTNYKVSYPNGTKKLGQLSATITFTGDYEGTKKLTYTVLPAAPTTVTAELTNSSSGYNDITVSWSKVSNATGYYVYYKKASASKYTLLAKTTATKYVKKNLTAGTRYYFQVYPYYKSSTYKSTAYKSANVYTLKKLSTPKVAKSGSKVKVTWTNISGETGYQISQATSKSKTKIVATYKTTSGKSKTIKATKGKKLYYKVRAYKEIKVGSKKVKVYGPWSAVKLYKR